MKVSEIMTTNPACCIPSDAAQTAAIIMRDEDTGIVPVVESKGSSKLVGVVTDRDLCIGVIAERPRALDPGLDATNAPIEQFMTGPQEILECDGSRCGAVVEKDGNGSMRAVGMYIAIGDARVDALIIYSAPVRPVASTTPSGLPAWGPRSARGSVTRGLMRRQNDEAQSFVD